MNAHGSEPDVAAERRRPTELASVVPWLWANHTLLQSASAPDRAIASQTRSARGWLRRQTDRKHTAPPRQISRRDIAAMRTRCFPRDGQSQAGTPRVRAAHEQFEQALRVTSGEAAAFIFHLDDHVAILSAGAHLDRSAIVGEFDGVLQQILDRRDDDLF